MDRLCFSTPHGRHAEHACYFQGAIIASGSSIVVLLGGGVESTALVAGFLRDGRSVLPVHVHTGLLWDDTEAEWVRRFCSRLAGPLWPLVQIRVPLQDFLGGHWAVTGIDVPAARDDAARLEIPLRNLTLLGLALHRVKNRVGELDLALGTTADNHYPDGRRDYFDQCERLLGLEAGRPVRIHTPLINATKVQVIREADPTVLAQSFSCVNPTDGQHCGRCIKCGKRQAAFRAAGIADPTVYFEPCDSRTG